MALNRAHPGLFCINSIRTVCIINYRLLATAFAIG